MATTFIYALCEPGTRTIRYIGKTNNPKKRFKEHVNWSSRATTYLGRWLGSLKSPPEMITIREVDTNGCQEEIKYIDLGRRLGLALVNATNGGEGTLGFYPSKETREKLSAARKGRRLSEETKIKMGESKRGKPRSLETRAKISASKRGVSYGYIHSPETRAKISAANIGRVIPPLSSEARAKISRANRGRKHSPEARAKISAANRGANHPLFGKRHSVETRNKMSFSHLKNSENLCAPIS